MRILILILLSSLVIACSGSKKTITSNLKTQNNSSKMHHVKDAPKGKVDNSEATLRKVAKVIEKHAKCSINDIARSQIVKTKNGYWWKFVNVRTGQKYTVTTDANFNAVQIQKNYKKRT